MIDVAILSVIRRWPLREGVSIREIALRTKLSRNTNSQVPVERQAGAGLPEAKEPEQARRVS